MTFTKNAAAEMRQRVLEYLKKAYHGDREVLDWLLALVSIDEGQLHTRCEELIDAILQDYSSFQVQTIDSFMVRVFRASALEFGFSPTLDIVLDSNKLLNEAFEKFAFDLATDPSKRLLLEQLTDILVESQISSRYIWDPFQKLSDEVRKLYNTLSSQAKEILLPSNISGNLNELEKQILDTYNQLYTLVRESGLETTKNFETVIDIAAKGNVDDLIERKSLYNKPIKSSGTKALKQKAEEWTACFTPLQERLRSLAADYLAQQARSYYRPYVEAHRLFSGTIEHIMRLNGQITLGNINRVLLKYISEEVVPQLYFYLGDIISHYLIDEFQDTSPIQWEAMKPLLAEALSKQGSLFIVGDTKQSIYTFRNADWRIMKNLMDKNVFPSAPTEVLELETNYRSFEQILDFNKTVFHEIVPREVEGDAPHTSGLSSFKQKVKKGNRKKGYVEVAYFDKNEEQIPERAKILEIVNDCCKRGYSLGEITILTPKNEHVITISGWLNSEHIKFISHSSLDIRGRTITGNIIALLRFLDSPIDDLPFATFLLSNTFYRTFTADNIKLTKEELRSFLLQARREDHSAPLYVSFRRHFNEIWKRYFEELFTIVGYLPMYDLVSEIYKQFRLFELAPDEEATLVKLLEVIKDFEETGHNNLKDFLIYTESEVDEAKWNIAVPQGIDAVSVMTIHKAKGLDNRVIIVLLVDTNPRADNMLVEENEDGIQLVHITQKNAEYNDALQRLYNHHCLERAVDNLNKLYVAFTRAKEEMYIISVKTKYADEPSKFLPKSGYDPNGKPKVESRPKSSELIASTYHTTSRIPPTVVSSEKMALYERRRGEMIHEILSHIEFVDAKTDVLVATTVNEVAGSWMEPSDMQSITLRVLEFLRLPDVAQYYSYVEGRNVLNEQEFVNSEGRLFRMDRIVVDVSTVTVLDFKTGDDKDTYTDQLHGYMEILQNFYPDRIINGVLAFVDRKKIRTIV